MPPTMPISTITMINSTNVNPRVRLRVKSMRAMVRTLVIAPVARERDNIVLRVRHVDDDFLTVAAPRVVVATLTAGAMRYPVRPATVPPLQVNHGGTGIAVVVIHVVPQRPGDPGVTTRRVCVPSQ